MTTKKLNYLEETLKRWPIIVIAGTIGWFGINKLHHIESVVDRIQLLTEKEKEAFDTRFVMIETKSERTENKANELEKSLIRIQAILPERTEIKDK